MTNAQEPRTIAAQIEALAPCPNPWCGGSNVFPIQTRHRDEWTVSCGCGFIGPIQANATEAIAAWNTRPAIVTALKQAEAAPEVVEATKAQQHREREAQMYRKTALVQAEQFLPNEGKIPAGVYSSERADPRKNPLAEWVLNTLEGPHYPRDGDYICTGPAGERWNVECSVFEATYEPINAPPSADAAMVGEDQRTALAYQRRAGVEDAINWLLAHAESHPPKVLYHAAGILARQMRDELAPDGTDKLPASQALTSRQPAGVDYAKYLSVPAAPATDEGE